MAITVRALTSVKGRDSTDRWSFLARARRFLRFGLVGMSGVLVNEAALAVLVNAFHVNYLLGAVLATQCSTLWNFALVEWWAFEDVGTQSGRGRRFVMFWTVNMVALGLRGPILALLTSTFHIHYLISNLVSLGVLVLLRFAVADSLIWGKTAPPSHPAAPSDLLTHFPRDLIEDIGWALNPVAEAEEVLHGHSGGDVTDHPGPFVVPAAECRTEERSDRLAAPDPPRRYGSITPPTGPAPATEPARRIRFVAHSQGTASMNRTRRSAHHR